MQDRVGFRVECVMWDRVGCRMWGSGWDAGQDVGLRVGCRAGCGVQGTVLPAQGRVGLLLSLLTLASP